MGEDVRGAEVPAPAEEMEKKQKILLWLMEGQKELVQHKRSSYGSVFKPCGVVARSVALITMDISHHALFNHHPSH